mmetsp:Transcript_2197/g.4725  ORF Transcript_2197/g.4725 Transcript_2197/m.4725 type:complete len:137 (+) Transcript_2197:140-550(+)
MISHGSLRGRFGDLCLVRTSHSMRLLNQIDDFDYYHERKYFYTLTIIRNHNNRNPDENILREECSSPQVMTFLETCFGHITISFGPFLLKMSSHRYGSRIQNRTFRETCLNSTLQRRWIDFSNGVPNGRLDRFSQC